MSLIQTGTSNPIQNLSYTSTLKNHIIVNGEIVKFNGRIIKFYPQVSTLSKMAYSIAYLFHLLINALRKSSDKSLKFKAFVETKTNKVSIEELNEIHNNIRISVNELHQNNLFDVSKTINYLTTQLNLNITVNHQENTAYLSLINEIVQVINNSYKDLKAGKKELYDIHSSKLSQNNARLVNLILNSPEIKSEYKKHFIRKINENDGKINVAPVIWADCLLICIKPKPTDTTSRSSNESSEYYIDPSFDKILATLVDQDIGYLTQEEIGALSGKIIERIESNKNIDKKKDLCDNLLNKIIETTEKYYPYFADNDNIIRYNFIRGLLSITNVGIMHETNRAQEVLYDLFKYLDPFKFAIHHFFTLNDTEDKKLEIITTSTTQTKSTNTITPDKSSSKTINNHELQEFKGNGSLIKLMLHQADKFESFSNLSDKLIKEFAASIEYTITNKPDQVSLIVIYYDDLLKFITDGYKKHKFIDTPDNNLKNILLKILDYTETKIKPLYYQDPKRNNYQYYSMLIQKCNKLIKQH